MAKTDAYSEETTEIFNDDKNDEPYIGIYGSFIEIFVVTLSLVQRDCFQDDNLYNIENISEILRMVFDESTLSFHFNKEAASKVAKILQSSNKPNEEENEGKEEKEEPALTDLRNLT